MAGEKIQVRGRDGKSKIIAIPSGFLSEVDKQKAIEIGAIPGIYADGSVVKADGTIIDPPVIDPPAPQTPA